MERCQQFLRVYDNGDSFFMSPPNIELMKLTLEKKITHGWHPVMRWMADNIFIIYTTSLCNRHQEARRLIDR